MKLFTLIYDSYLVPFSHQLNAIASRNALLAPYFNEVSADTILLMGASLVIALIVSLYALKAVLYVRPRPNEPPIVPYWVPYFGSAVIMGMDPIKFYRESQEKYGNYFTFILLGRRMVTCLGPEGNNFLFNAKLADVSAEDAYRSLTVPVFGRGVVYDVDNSILMEQKKFVKSGLSTENLRAYVPMIEMETKNYLARWNMKSSIENLYHAMSELTIMTASRCLLGEEVRSKLDSSFAQIYHDLDGGFQPINFLFDNLPLPSNKLRDQAHMKMHDFFLDIMKSRRESDVKNRTDIMQYLTTECQYKNGRKLSDEESANIMIAMLMAGQHTSSTTSSWAFLFLAENPEFFEQLRQEQIEILGSLDAPLTFDALKKLTLHDNVVRETLRLRAPLLAVIRKVLKDLPIPETNYVIPKGAYIQSVQTISARSEEHFEQAEKFNPHRWEVLDQQNNKSQNDNFVDYGFGALNMSKARSPYLPFGAGRHRCIGEAFAYLQIKTIIATTVRTFKFELPNNKLPESDFTTMVIRPKDPLIKYVRSDY